MLPVERLATEPAEGLRNTFMTRADTEAVLALLHEVKPKRVLEIGINYGFTAREILQRVPGIEEYIGIDVYPGYELAPRFQWPEIPLFPGREVKGDPRVKLMIKPRGTLDVDPDEIGDVDVCIIDGDHSAEMVEKDTMLAYGLVREGGVVIWHDCSETTNTDVPEVLNFIRAKGAPIMWAAGTAVAFERIR